MEGERGSVRILLLRTFEGWHDRNNTYLAHILMHMRLWAQIFVHESIVYCLMSPLCTAL